jgi:hypothetical protein
MHSVPAGADNPSRWAPTTHATSWRRSATSSWTSRSSSSTKNSTSPKTPPKPRLHCPAPGALAQLGERRLCKPEVTGSIPVRSTYKSAACGNFLFSVLLTTEYSCKRFCKRSHFLRRRFRVTDTRLKHPEKSTLRANRAPRRCGAPQPSRLVDRVTSCWPKRPLARCGPRHDETPSFDALSLLG